MTIKIKDDTMSAKSEETNVGPGLKGRWTLFSIVISQSSEEQTKEMRGDQADIGL